MISRVCAVALAVLIALPFTAPFATVTLLDTGIAGRAHRGETTVTTPSASTADGDVEDGLATIDRSHFVLSTLSVTSDLLGREATVLSLFSRFVSTPAAPASTSFCPFITVLRV